MKRGSTAKPDNRAVQLHIAIQSLMAAEGRQCWANEAALLGALPVHSRAGLGSKQRKKSDKFALRVSRVAD